MLLNIKTRNKVKSIHTPREQGQCASSEIGGKGQEKQQNIAKAYSENKEVNSETLRAVKYKGGGKSEVDIEKE